MAEYIDRKQIKYRKERVLNSWAGSKHTDCDVSYKTIVEKYDINNIPTADVIERSTMKILCNEYLSKCNCCDECCAETYCILNSLRTENRDCVNNLITYFTKRNRGVGWNG